jgi:hypothetical protein
MDKEKAERIIKIVNWVRYIILAVFLTFVFVALSKAQTITAHAQDTKTKELKGKAIVQVFGNFHTGFGAENDNRALN